MGVSSGNKADVDLLVGGNSHEAVTVDSTNHNGVLVTGRSGLFHVPQSTFVSTRLNNGRVEGGAVNKYTTFSAFSLEGSFNQDSNLYAMVAKPVLRREPFSSSSFILPLQSINAPRITFNVVNGNAFECKVGGVFVFSISTKVAANRYIRLVVQGLEVNFELSSLVTNRNGARSFSRTFVANCNQGTTVTLKLEAGEILEAASTVFTAFPYRPTDVQNQVWGVYKTYGTATSSGNSLDPFLFDKILVNPGNLYEESSRRVMISEAGFYYVHLSTGVQRNVQVNMRVVRIAGNSRQEENVFFLRTTDTTSSGLLSNVSDHHSGIF